MIPPNLSIYGKLSFAAKMFPVGTYAPECGCISRHVSVLTKKKAADNLPQLPLSTSFLFCCSSYLIQQISVIRPVCRHDADCHIVCGPGLMDTPDLAVGRPVHKHDHMRRAAGYDNNITWL